MEYLVISITAVLVAGLSLFSGFGLGTILMPLFALFFPVPVAIAATAAVHLANNIFKAVLIGRKADKDVVLRFGVPALLAAFLGAWLLTFISDMPTLFAYTLFGELREVTIVKLVIAVIIIAFALFDLIPALTQLAFDQKYLVLGGMLSGFFGGISGNQGALRSAFLLKAGLDKESFVGTASVSSLLVDLARLVVYGLAFYSFGSIQVDENIYGLVVAAVVAAFVGSYVARQLLKKVTLRTVQLVVGIMLILIGLAMAAGLI